MKGRALVVGITLAIATPAAAQVDSALLSKIPFNLANPGGKSLAMGGAFTAIADDATAALANPAGLGLLGSFEVGLSAKRFDDVTELSTGRSTASGNGFLVPYPGVVATNSDIRGTISNLEYAGAVLPVSRRFVAALFYSENLRFRGDPGPGGYDYIELRDNRSGGQTRRDYLFEYREFGPVSLTNRLLGLSVGYRVTESLRVGAGVTLNRMRFDLEGDDGGPHRIVNRTFLTPTQTETRTVTMSVEDLSSTVPGFVVGFHADLLPNGRLTAGGSFRYTKRATGTLVFGGSVPAPLANATRRTFTFGVPKDAALGLAAQPLPGLVVAAEAQWIAYSDTAKESLPVVSYDGLVGPAPGFPVSGVLAALRAPKDVLVPRLGLEYVASAEPVRIAFRLGWHREPAHGVTSDLVARDGSGNPYDLVDPPYSDAVRKVFEGGKPDDRFSGGLGLTFQRALSLDLSFDLGRSSRLLSASLFWRF